MPARLTLICHAATEAVRLGRFPADEDLDADGRATLATITAPEAGLWLSAPELRTRRTASVLAGRDVEVAAALHDWDLGAWTGRTLAAFVEADAAAVARWRTDPSAAPHGGESLEALLARISGWMAATAGRGGRVVAVTHPAVARAAIVTALGAGPSAFWCVDAAPLARARLSHDRRRWALQALVPPTDGTV